MEEAVTAFEIMAQRVKAETVQEWIQDYPELMYNFTEHTIYCTQCKTDIGCKKSTLKRHVESSVHKGTSMKNNKEDFNIDLVNFLILCNIPWSKLNNAAFRQFFEKYLCCKCADRPTLPSETKLRKVYLGKSYKMKITSIYEKISNEKLWISLDETTDFLGRYVVNFLVMPLNSATIKKPYLIACKVLEQVNGNTISQFVVNCLENVWSDQYETKVGNVLLLSTDSVAYMLRAGQLLKALLPNMKHVTCLAHALHRVAEKIRSEYPDVDTLIANVKNIFLKAPYRVKIFKEKCPNVPLPPQPVITRWGTWLQAADYYAKHFESIKNVLSFLRAADAISIRNAKNILEKENLQRDLTFISENYSTIQIALLKLQKQNLSIIEAIEILDEVRTVLEWTASDPVKEKLDQVLSRNPDLEIIRGLSENLSRGELFEADILNYRYAPLTSVDVERSFSIYKWILNVKRNSLKMENIEKIIVIFFNNDDDDDCSGSYSTEEDIE